MEYNATKQTSDKHTFYDSVGTMKIEHGITKKTYDFYTNGKKFMVHTGSWFEEDIEDGVIAYEISELEPQRRELLAFLNSKNSVIISLINYTKGEMDAHLDIYVQDIRMLKIEMIRKLMYQKEFKIYYSAGIISIPEINYMAYGLAKSEKMLAEYRDGNI